MYGGCCLDRVLIFVQFVNPRFVETYKPMIGKLLYKAFYIMVGQNKALSSRQGSCLNDVGH